MKKNANRRVAELADAGLLPPITDQPPPQEVLTPCTHRSKEMGWLTQKGDLQFRQTCVLCGVVRNWIDKEQGEAGGTEWRNPWEVGCLKVGLRCKEVEFHKQLTIRGSQFDKINLAMNNAVVGTDLGGLEVVDFVDRVLIYDPRPHKVYPKMRWIPMSNVACVAEQDQQLL